MKRFNLIIAILIISFKISYSQNRKARISGYDPINFGKLYNIGLVTGISGFNTTNFEVGVALNFVEGYSDKKIPVKPFMGNSLSFEINSTNPDLIAYNYTMWINALMVYGLKLSYNNDGLNSTWAIKPSIGFGVYSFSFDYGYNFHLGSNEIIELTHHVFTIRYYLPIVKLRKNAL